MTLEFEKLADEIETMAQTAARRQQAREIERNQLLDRLHEYATRWNALDAALEQAQALVDEKYLRAARPLDELEPMDAAIAPAAPPAVATLMAVDGSQILPDRHAAFMYYLINIGLIVYEHGSGAPPAAVTLPQLAYPTVDGEDDFVDNGAIVNLRRDLAEIESLAEAAWQRRGDTQPRLALLDQRLLYWPIGGAHDAEGSRVLDGWQAAMTKTRDAGSWLAGYIDQPGKRSVITLLHALDIGQPGFNKDKLILRQQGTMTDADLFGYLLEPGQRSKVFVDVSQHNNDFHDRDADNEVCFFYLNPGRRGRVARVDIPMWVAADPEAIAAVHALVYDQCDILGGYPYVLTRADEQAVVGSRDQADLENLIESAMQRFEVDGRITAKQMGKDLARAGRTAHRL